MKKKFSIFQFIDAVHIHPNEQTQTKRIVDTRKEQFERMKEKVQYSLHFISEKRYKCVQMHPLYCFVSYAEKK